MSQSSPRLVVTVDTEPDDQWAPPGADGRLPPFSFANTRGLGHLADFLHERGVPVTWMTSYAVARDRESVHALRRAAAEGDEIAGHLHGWEAPPHLDVDHRHRPFIYEYEPEIRLAKHRALHAALGDAFGDAPVSYRAGRWGLDALELEHLAELGYRIDSSVPPGIDFRDRGGPTRLGPDFRRFLEPAAPQPYRASSLWEVPVAITTIGRLGQGRLAVALARFAANRRRRRSAARLACALLKAGGLSRLVWVRPLKDRREVLARTARILVERRAPIVNVMLHSSEAFLGTSPWSRTRADLERLYGDLDAIVRAALASGAVARTLRDAVADLESYGPDTPSSP